MYHTPGLYHHEVAFADPLRKMHDYCRGVVSNADIPQVHDKKDGTLMQVLGDWARETYGADVFINIAMSEQMKFRKMHQAHASRIVTVISDGRFLNEFEGFYEDALMVRLEAPEHVRKSRAEMWRPNTTHKSETDLDTYSYGGWFDMEFSTYAEVNTPAHMATLIIAQLMKDVWKEKRE